MRSLNIPYKVLHTCDCDKNAILSYAAMRTDFAQEFSRYSFPSQEQMVADLQAKNVGYDFQKGKHTITTRTPINRLRQFYLADKLSKNLGDISKVGKLPYADFVTYSYPCTDISVSGKGEGMSNKCDNCDYTWPIDFETPKTNNICPNCGNIDIKSTRSGLLGQVQRLLTVSYNEGTLPKYLLLENVKNLVGKKFKPQFDSWINWLDLIGYNTYYQVLNGKHYGIPQNRERIFAISIRKDVDIHGYVFPETIPLRYRLKHLLEDNVDEQYYLPDERLDKILATNFLNRNIPLSEAKVDQIGNCMPGTNRDNPNQGRVYNTEGLSPTLTKMDGGNRQPFIIEDEINVVGNYMPSNHDASRVVDINGIAPTVKENHGTVTAIAEPLIDKLEQKKEPQVLRAERTEYGKAIRKQYEAGEVKEKIGSMRKLKPRTDGISNTITTLLKDNYVYEPIIYDDYNSRISADQEAINTLTCNCGASAERNGVKIITPVIIDDMYGNREPRVYDETAPTLRSERTGLKVADYYRIRKLTPKECWRLMAFSDEDFNLAKQYVANNALYKQAGNSIIVNCLIAIMSSLFLTNGHQAAIWSQYILNPTTILHS